MGVAIKIEITRGKANLISKTPLKKFIIEAVIVEAEFIKSPVALAKFIGAPIILKIGTKAMALPTPPIAKIVEKNRVSPK